MPVYALNTISHGVKDGNGVKRIEFAPGEEIAEKEGVKISSAEVKDWIKAGLASRHQPQVDEDEVVIDEVDEKGEKRSGSVKATKTNPPKGPKVVTNDPPQGSEPQGGAQP